MFCEIHKNTNDDPEFTGLRYSFVVFTGSVFCLAGVRNLWISNLIGSKLSLDFKIIHSRSNWRVKTCVKQSLKITLNIFLGLPGAAEGPSTHFFHPTQLALLLQPG